MEAWMIIGTVVLLIICPQLVIFGFVALIIYILIPNDVYIRRMIERSNKRTERRKSKLLDSDILNFIHGENYDKFGNEPTFLILREYRNRLCDELSKNSKIKANTEGIKKIFKYDITIESEFVEYLKDLYLRRYTKNVRFSWLNKEERIVLSRLDLLKKYDYYEDLRKRWYKAHNSIRISVPPKNCWEGLPGNQENYWRSLNRGEV